MTEAGDFLHGLLAEGPVPARRVYAEGREAGHSERTLRRAQKARGIEAIKDGLKGGWLWRWRAKSAEGGQDGQHSELGAFGRDGHLDPMKVAERGQDGRTENLAALAAFGAASDPSKARDSGDSASSGDMVEVEV